MTYTPEIAIKLCTLIENLLAVHSIPCHVALTGSCLYDGGSEDDIDIIIYPHNPTENSALDYRDKIEEVVDKLLKASNSPECDFYPPPEPFRRSQEYVNREVTKFRSQHYCLDIFFS